MKLNILWGLILFPLLSYSQTDSISNRYKKTIKVRVPGAVLLPSESGFQHPLWVDQTEVSNIDWKEFIQSVEQDDSYGLKAENLKPDTSIWKKFTYGDPYMKTYFSHPAFNSYPLVGISYEQALAYCKWRSKIVTRYYNENNKSSYKVIFKFRLPTPEEWKKFALAEKLASIQLSKPEWYLKENFSTLDRDEKKVAKSYRSFNHLSVRNLKDTDLKDPFLNIGDAYAVTSPASTQTRTHGFKPNDYGLYNLLGNVSEMTSERGVAMGGNWYSEPRLCLDVFTQAYNKSSEKGYVKYTQPQPWLGFRCVCEVELVPK
ncbi:MAG: formylglycine-generating enzyme family protein [Bacteroidia bacterium]|nr:formylglycine-generating enzyme family protein [Bacteroidia bacterium]